MNPAAVVEQFTYGKLIEGNRDLRGFTLVARSPGVPPENLIAQIRAMADVGQIYQLESYTGSDTAFTLNDYAVVARFQRSPKQYARGYFIQDHYLILSKEQFASLGHNYAYLLSLLPETIPWRSQEEKLPALALPARNLAAELHHVSQTLNQYQEQLFQALLLALREQPFVIIPPNDTASTYHFLEALTLLLPPAQRGQLSWAINVMNLRQNKARIKLMLQPPAGSQHITIRLDHSQLSVAALPLGSDAAASAINTMRQYLERFSATALLQMIESLESQPNLPWSGVALLLAQRLWHTAFPTILSHDLAKTTTPDQQLLTRVVSVLDDSNFSVSAEQQTQFILAVAQAVLSGQLPVEDAPHLPQYISQASPEQIWPALTQQFTQPHPQRWALLAAWRQNPQFWSHARLQELITQVYSQEMSRWAGQPEQALQFLRQRAIQQIQPVWANLQAQLLNQAVNQAAPQSHFKSLLLTWLTMKNDLSRAKKVAQDVPLLAHHLWRNANGPYHFIGAALQGEPAPQVNQWLAQQPSLPLDDMADLLLALALAGEKWQLTGFRAWPLLDAISRRAKQLPPAQLEQLADLLKPQLGQMISIEEQSALLGLMLAAEQTQEVRHLLANDWRWLDTLMIWLRRCAALTPAVQNGVNLAVSRFQSPPPLDMSAGERRKLLRQLFEIWLNFTRGTLKAIDEPSLLLLQDAFNPQQEEAVAQPAQPGFRQKIQNAVGNLFQQRLSQSDQNLLAQIVRRIHFVHSHLFNAPVASTIHARYSEQYGRQLGLAFQTGWQRPELTGALLTALQQSGLDYEAAQLRNANVAWRGQEILVNLNQSLPGLFKLMNLLDEAESMTPAQISALLDEPTRAQLKTNCHYAGQYLDTLRQQLQQLAQKL